MTVFFQYLVNGIVIGGTYSLIGMGMTLIFGIMRIVNFAHGEFYMLGAYFLYTLWAILGLNPVLSMLFTFVLILFLGIGFEQLFLRPLRKESSTSSMLMTIGFSIVLQNAALLIWGGATQTVPTLVDLKTFSIGDVVFSTDRILVFLISLTIIIFTSLFIGRTKTGRSMRATFQDMEAAEVVGVNIERVYSITFGFGAALAAAGGFLLAPLFVISPTMGALATSKAFAVVTAGGLGNVRGAILGGLLLGVVESLGAGYIASGYKDAFGYLIIILVILFKPEGLMSRKRKKGVHA
ncbi:MAG TPA: branched-chain amino acid ABC transporter permease [Clostridiaceae bacterium]|jgi:branched-chain amino acid transport system permease protein|nr:branched-chain amino acid ABC transporter permease [Clostridiaceae bacterium]